MKERYDENDEIMELIGLGRFSSHKSYYPELQKKIKELEEEKEKYKSLFENVISGILRLDTNGRILNANFSASEILGIPEFDVSSNEIRFIQKYIGEKSFNELKEYIDKKGSLLGYETEIETDYGKRWLHLNASNSLGVNSEKSYDIVLEDITKNHEFRIQLENSEKRNRELFENSPLSIVVYDLDGYLVKFNRSFVELLGLNSDYELLKNHSYNIFKDKSFVKYGVIEQVKKVMNGENTDIVECLYEIPEDFKFGSSRISSVWVKVHCYGDCDEDGNIAHIFMLLENVSKRKRAENELRDLNQSLEIRVKNRTEELEKINNELKDFAYIVSHDLKAPLRGISQISSWLKEDYAERIDDEGRQLFDLMMDRTKKMEMMIEGILEYSRAGRKIKEYEEIDLNEVFLETIGIFPEIKDYAVSKMNLPVIFAEKLKVEQIFQNLISNSVKYMDKAEPKIGIKFQQKEDHFSLFFCDNGCGIEEKYHKKIFEIFQTLDTSDKKRGTGIGLALVKKIVENYGGSIELKSKANEGTCMIVNFPNEYLKK